jgi:hypothetical protein
MPARARRKESVVILYSPRDISLLAVFLKFQIAFMQYRPTDAWITIVKITNDRLCICYLLSV